MIWAQLVIAGLLEVVWAFTMKQSDGFSRTGYSIVTILAMIASFWLLARAMAVLPLGTAYVIWTGIGSVGAFVLGLTLLGETASPARIGAAVMIIGGIILMKISSS
ncbi:quaternary ammonium compound-resistance protein SugE [Paracoccus isoporae]|uniref:Guanidinium exporter n=1 Tax=Paracoccus isoporae TaxID=591205 RepID=A0A1G7GCL5_9RHOB|nr:SMR family transporter [Paracoccus isoporae]SDE85815.1 quaternary ammonium compound-resistance protein SugE [Paracoccus isoporae]